MESTGGSKGSRQGYMGKEQQYAKQHDGARLDKAFDTFPQTLIIKEHVLRGGCSRWVKERAARIGWMTREKCGSNNANRKKDTSRLTSHKYISLEKAILLKEKNNVGYKKKEVGYWRNVVVVEWVDVVVDEDRVAGKLWGCR